jgi:hemerythrin superfamily protein
MAKSKKSALPLALEMLEADHRNVEALFEAYEQRKEDGEEARRAVAEKICGELTVHAQVEEEIFYPWLRENLSGDDLGMVEEADVEHATAKDLIGQIEDAPNVDEAYDARVKVLSEYIKHHVKEEEQEIFPKVAEHAEELDELGQLMGARKTELREELGLEEGEEAGHDVPPASMAMRGKRGARGAQRAR